MLQKLTTALGIIISLIILISATIYISYWRNVNIATQKLSEEVNFTVEQGDRVQNIGKNLKENGLIKSSFSFGWHVAFQNIDKKLQAGEYRLDKNMNLKEIAKALATGNTLSNEKTVKIIEGWRIKEIAEYLAKEHGFSAEEFIKLTKSGTGTCFTKEICQFSYMDSISKGKSLEGYLFPDTYRVFEDATIEEVIAKMLNNFELKITDGMLKDIKKQGKTLHEIIIMASLIEKEVPNADDMKMISDVFYKRLKIGMALQSDATINYFTNKGTTRPSFDDLEIEHPYNTYRNPGLMPGPISNPGISAIEAAIYPKPNEYYYFLTTPKGKVIYTKTYERHLEEKYKYYK